METRSVAKPAINYGDTKEMIKAISVIDCTNKKEVIVMRWYMGRSRNASRVYCSVWFKHIEENRSGTAWSGGWGYDKREDSGYRALRAAGILADTTGGHGIESTLVDVARHYGFENTMIISHG